MFDFQNNRDNTLACPMTIVFPGKLTLLKVLLQMIVWVGKVGDGD